MRIWNQSGRASLILIGVILALLLLSPLVLHFAQKRHDRLAFDINVQFPPGQPFTNGAIYAATAAAVMDQELTSTTGWRPNDFFLWGPSVTADNNANRQLGIIQALRESIRVFKDNLTKVSSNEYDANLVATDTAFRNDATKFWFPSAESKFKEGVRALHKYVDGLETDPPKSKPITRRNIELIRLFQTWGDLLGDGHANLFKTHEPDGSGVRMWRTDDYYYHAQGFAHVMYHLMLALKREYEVDVVNRPSVSQLFDEVTDALGRASLMKPVVVLDGGPDGLFANHRRNLDVYIAEARQKMYSIREELEK